MLPWLFLKGFLIGMSIAAPVGPIGILCIRRSLMQGRLVGIASGFGVATADACYAAIAAFGVTAVSGFLISNQRWFELIGGAFLVYLGLRILKSIPPPLTGEVKRMRLLRAYSSIFALTMANPATILSFAALFTGLGVARVAVGNPAHTSIMVLGVFAGSCTWWLFLNEVLYLLRKRLSGHFLRWTNLVSGSVILGFGILVFAKGVM